MVATSSPFVRLTGEKAVLLTSFRRDGTPVGTPVSVAVDGDRAFIRSFRESGKVKRILRNPDVTVAPCTLSGKVTGAALPARARVLSGEDARRASQAISRKHRLLQGLLVPLGHRLMRRRTVHLELEPREWT